MSRNFILGKVFLTVSVYVLDAEEEGISAISFFTNRGSGYFLYQKVCEVSPIGLYYFVDFSVENSKVYEENGLILGGGEVSIVLLLEDGKKVTFRREVGVRFPRINDKGVTPFIC